MYCTVAVTTAVEEALGPQTTLQEAKFVPCVRMHFKWEEDGIHGYLRDDVYTKLTSSEAAGLLASKYRLVILDHCLNCQENNVN